MKIKNLWGGMREEVVAVYFEALSRYLSGSIRKCTKSLFSTTELPIEIRTDALPHTKEGH